MSEAYEKSQETAADSLPTTPEQLFARLDALGISYKLYNHRPIFTVSEGADLKKEIPGTHCRNLFIYDKKKTMFLLTLSNDTIVDNKKLPDVLGSGRISFCQPERLWKYLGIRPGSVNPFCIVNDTDKEVEIVLDRAMVEADIINVHPFDNAMTIGLSPDGLLKFLADAGRVPRIVDFTPAAPDPSG